MWIRKRTINELKQEIADCKRKIQQVENDADEKMIQLAKRILRQPEELSKEIDENDKIDEFVKKFINL